MQKKRRAFVRMIPAKKKKKEEKEKEKKVSFFVLLSFCAVSIAV